MRRLDFSQIRRSPKSTIVGLCVLALAAGRGIRFSDSGRLAMTTKDWFEVGCGLLTAVVSGVSRDAQASAGTNGSQPKVLPESGITNEAQ